MSTKLSTAEWKSLAQEVSPQGKAFIGGKYVDAISQKTFATINPATGKEIVQVASCDKQDIDEAVKAARNAFGKGVWCDMHPGKRKKIMLKFAELIGKNFQELALLETLDSGKPINDSVKVDIPLAAQCIAWFAETIDKSYDQIAPTGKNALVTITREPMGVVAAVVPWNFPLLMASWKLGPALAMGNSVILKPAEQSPLTAIRVAELAMQAGIPEGVLNVVPGFGETAGKAIGMHMDIDCVAFTGSAEVGKYFLEYAGKSNMKRISLECGGKSPNIVAADCPDIERAAMISALGIFYNQGEVCNAGSRLLVEKSIKDELLEKILAWGKKLYPGDPLDTQTAMGAIIDQTQMDKVLGYIETGQKEGASMISGGNRVHKETGGYYIEPTVFDQVNNDMKIARDEIFGPVLATITFENFDEAIKIANDSQYGLGAAVWTKDINKAHKTARALRAGTVWVNCFGDGDITAPFGGYKQSGFGRDKSLHALEKFCELKTTWINLK